MSRTTGALALTASLMLALAAAPALGQDDEPVASSAMCDLLTPAEIQAAVGGGSPVVNSFSDDYCIWHIDEQASASVSAWFDAGSGFTDVTRLIYPTPVEVGGVPALQGPEGDVIAEIGQNTLMLQIQANEPSAVEFDVPVAVRELAAIATARLPSVRTLVLATTDPELEAMFPTAITGADGIRVESSLVGVMLAQLEEDDPEQAAAATEQLAGLVSPVGRSVDELALGEGAFRIGDGADAIVGRLDALRLPGADAAVLLEAYLEVAGLAGAERTLLRIADRDVIVVSPDGRDQYLYAAGDVVWNLYQQGGSGFPEETLAEILSQLPLP